MHERLNLAEMIAKNGQKQLYVINQNFMFLFSELLRVKERHGRAGPGRAVIFLFHKWIVLKKIRTFSSIHFLPPTNIKDFMRCYKMPYT